MNFHSHDLRRLAAFAAGTLALLVVVAVASNAEQFVPTAPDRSGRRNVLPIEGGLSEARTVEQPEIVVEEENTPVEMPDWLVIALASALGLGFLYLVSRQTFRFRFRRPKVRFGRDDAEISEEQQADAIADLADDLIHELNEGDSPRYAIQRAYAAVETGFGARELARKPAESPLRYLDRIFGRHTAVRGALTRLTDLFQHARFSQAPVDESMRADAISALTEIRDYYKEFAWSKIESRRARARS